jgi:hypothetical protein
MNAPVVMSYFNEKTRAQFLSSPMKYLGSAHRAKVTVGTLVVLTDLDAKSIFGIAVVDNAPDAKTPCIEHPFLDMDTYSLEYQKYNKYEIHLSGIKIFSTQITFEQIRTLLGGDAALKGAGNMWRGFHCNFAGPFQKGVDIKMIQRYCFWINTLVN